MTTIKTKDYTGYSQSSIDEAMLDALQKAGNYHHVEVIETRSSQNLDEKRQYQVTLTIQDNVR